MTPGVMDYCYENPRMCFTMDIGEKMSIAIIVLTILGYWIAMGFFMATVMFSFYMFAVIVGDMAERLKAAVC
jgi:hypothetical protein